MLTGTGVLLREPPPGVAEDSSKLQLGESGYTQHSSLQQAVADGKEQHLCACITVTVAVAVVVVVIMKDV